MSRSSRNRPFLAFALLASCTLGSCATTGYEVADLRWQILDSGIVASLRGLHAVDAETIWATGSAGTVLLSVDGGATLEKRILPGAEGNELRDVTGFDARTAFVLACQPARIYRTTDGGLSFDLVLDGARDSGDPQAFFDGLSFFDRRTGVAFGDPVGGRFLVYTTDDGGATWGQVPDVCLPPALPGEGAFAASGTCLTVLPDGRAWIGTGIAAARVLHSDDFGLSWRVAATPLGSGPTAGIFSLAMRGRGVGVAVGGDYEPENTSRNHAAVTADGGRSWRLVGALSPRGFRSCVRYVPGRRGTLVAVGPSGTDYSIDDGRSWRALSDEGFHVIAFAPDGTGFAAGSGGRVARLVRAEKGSSSAPGG